MSWEIRQGDVMDRLREMPDESVQCVITSPPYFGLRDYGTGDWEGGEDGCDHRQEAKARKFTNGRGEGIDDEYAGSNLTSWTTRDAMPRNACSKCGARRLDRQIGLEQTPDEYIARMVDVFREIRRVLRSDGTVWLNIGDSYNNRSVARPSSHQGGLGFTNESIERSWVDQTKLGLSRLSFSDGDLKEKDLLMIPAQLALVLRADGWYLRSEIVWSKPNPMPESVTDRPTSAHEKVFLLTKQSKYFYDTDAIRETDSGQDHCRDGQPSLEPSGGILNGHGGIRTAEGRNGSGRNKRNVWSIATQPYPDAHFATFPTKLVEPCVLAGSSPKACGKCGAPWERVVERTSMVVREGPGRAGMMAAANGSSSSRTAITGTMRKPASSRTIGWRPTCIPPGHPAMHDRSARCVVLDPFAGSGTVGVVCRWHDRDFIGIELNGDYCEMARRRIQVEGHPSRRRNEKPDVNDGQLQLI